MKRSTPKRSPSVSVKKKSAPANEIDEFLAKVPEPARTTLEKLRTTIRAAAPKATEGLSYQVPAFLYLGPLVSFGAAAKHCALYVMSGTALESYKDELSAYDTSKGTVRFPADKPLPVALVKKLVKARIAENEARALLKAGKSKPSTRSPPQKKSR
ncbi:DUF1801 domain-containing protein [Hyalangium sp.]|uniref:iron chaperone n=1 Tax=Hyalangium sp. TaxID=2028555 RepID=UPI002D2E15F8|nr:DUF1801 domain-containing protein [Hyalangium sp.]HYI00783.1 DUF1801 domain-containing protein [Hyalangium sp.]